MGDGRLCDLASSAKGNEGSKQRAAEQQDAADEPRLEWRLAADLGVRSTTVMKHPPVWIAWSAFALAWFVPVHKDGITLPQGLPGWEAFRLTAAAVWPYEGVDYKTWWDATLATLSAATNAVMLSSLWLAHGGQGRRRATAIAALLAFVINAQWLFWRTEWVDLRAGYYLWWLSFLLASLISVRRAVSATSSEDAPA
jgi:hypothetical protein